MNRPTSNIVINLSIFFSFLVLTVASIVELENKPLQIIRPDTTHSNLVIDEETIQMIEGIDESLAVVGVVGSFHSGKSFLLNQLMNKPAGFEVGPTVAAETMGLWIWGKPLHMTNPETGESVSVLFLDTEGFYASNISETYDAKIFGVSTLISSYLIFNSVKIIDQNDIDYLEILAKRTHLFSLKSQLRFVIDNKNDDNSNINNNNNNNNNNINSNINNNNAPHTTTYDTINFPPLMWVIEDFFQDLEGKTPTEWVHTLLQARPRDEQMPIATLRDIFPSVEAHTLFLPSVSSKKLQNLNGIKDDELHPEYKTGIDELRKKVMASVAPKKDSHLLSGKALVALLRMLVKAANAGTFPNVPSVWGAFLEQQLLSAQEDTLKVFTQETRKFSKEPLDISTVYTTRELSDLHTSAQDRSEDLFKKLLLGLKEVYTPGLQKLREKINAVIEAQHRENTKRIESLCESVRDNKVVDHELDMEKIALPVASKDLKQHHTQLADSLMQQYDQALAKFQSNVVFTKQRNELQNRITSSLNKFILDNTEKLKKVLSDSVDKAANLYKQKTSEITSALSYDEFMAIHKETSIEALARYVEHAKAAKDEPEYAPYMSHLKQAIDTLRTEFNDRNDKKIEVIISETRVECWQGFSKEVKKMDLPMDENELMTTMQRAQKSGLDLFKQNLNKFAKFDLFKAELKTFENQLEKKVSETIETNIQETKGSCIGPFLTAKQRIREEAGGYFWRWNLERRARQIAEEELTRSGKIKNSSFRTKVIERFMLEDTPEILDTTSTHSLSQAISAASAIVVILISFAVYFRKSHLTKVQLHRGR